MVTLNQIKPGSSARVVRAGSRITFRLLELGILPGALLKVVCQAPLGDPIAVKVDNTEVAIGREDASYILVETE